MIIEDNAKLAGDESRHINLKVKGNDENEMLFRIRRSTRLNKLMNAYCNRQSFDINSIKFLFNGYHVRADQTPLELDMEDGAEVDAIIDVSHDLNHKMVHRFQSGSHNNFSPYVDLQSGTGIGNVVGKSTNFVTVSLHNCGVNDKQAGYFATHLIDEDGTFNGVGLDNFIKKVKLEERGASYAVIAIMGPQCSGKSTLLNHLFHTNFVEMDACKGRSPTTKGLWIAKATSIEPCTIVMDLQGSGESDLGEDGSAFEKQSARFVLAISDIVIINMRCHDIGLEQAASKRLLKTIFQVIWQSSIRSKTSLMFVIRDQTSTPLENLEPLLREDIQKIWDSIPKPEAHKHTSLSEYFNVQVVALSSYEDGAEQFKKQVASLREKLFQSIITPDGLAGSKPGAVPASGFSFNAQQIWKVIKENKDIDFPAHKVLVVNPLREVFTNGNYSSSVANKAEVRTFSKRRKARPWTTNEETVLAEAWINTGSQRLSDSFWKQVLEYFRKQMGDTDRTVHQMNSKWKVMELKITKFNDIYHRMTKHYNDQSESGILHLTHLEYRRSNNKPFPNEAAWSIVKNHPKWSTSTGTSTNTDTSPVPPIDAHIQQPQKRLKIPEAESNNHTTSSDAQSSGRSGRDDEGDEQFNDEELEIPQQRQKTPASSSPRQQDREELLQKIVSEVSEISHILREDLEDKKRHRLRLEEIKLEKVRVMEEQLRRKQKEKDLQFYLQSHEHLTGMQLKVAVQCKEEITRRWGWE